MNYEELLNSAYEKVKKVEGTKDRFEPPEVKSMIEGIKTVFTNFIQICSYLRRDPEYLKKFLERELAAPSKIEGERLILVKKIPQRKLQEKVNFYTEKYVICKECGKPDTEIRKESTFMFIHCLACGAKHSISKL